ncbi:hypothetical protein N7490_008289 [Penicillium lividum]|nr:hypothetical protein N7490_008289 [Penicillium lividum]
MHGSTPAEPIYVSIAPINGGEITLPEHAFLFPSDPTTRLMVPSLSFLVTHPGSRDGNSQTTRILFDLGLRSKIDNYTEAQQAHMQARLPYKLGPGVAQCLRDGGLDPGQIDMVILSHVHYDHHGDPEDFPNARFLVGAGSLEILHHGLNIEASHQHFDRNLFTKSSFAEFPDPHLPPWQPVGPFEAAFDLFEDGSVYVVNAPGHLPGHINLLIRVQPKKWVCHGGDSYHYLRLLSGERQVATWATNDAHVGCIHLDKAKAEDTLSRIQKLTRNKGTYVEVIMAHDAK